MSSLDALRDALVVPDEALFAEFAAAVSAMRVHHFDWCRAHGIGDEALFSGPALCGVARVRFAGERYSPAPGGEPGVIVAVGEYDADGWHEISDLVVYQPGNPGRWALRRRDESILGRQQLDYAGETLSPVRLFATPHEWLVNSGNGVVVLDWNSALSWPFRDAQLLTSDTALAERLDHAIEAETTRARPEIRVAKETPDAAKA